MFYEPFKTVNEVEPFFGHSIYKNGKEMTVVGASMNNKVLYIQAVYEDGTELSLPSLNWFYSAKFMGHQFGRKMEMNENEKEF